ncbi:MAG: hypothetical protein HUU50_03155 [Candidatus Brocadiae bacterium]|nr:hypothetical protein [Candidatus Brocadiia bacterium]
MKVVSLDILTAYPRSKIETEIMMLKDAIYQKETLKYEEWSLFLKGFKEWLLCLEENINNYQDILRWLFEILFYYWNELEEELQEEYTNFFHNFFTGREKISQALIPSLYSFLITYKNPILSEIWELIYSEENCKFNIDANNIPTKIIELIEENEEKKIYSVIESYLYQWKKERKDYIPNALAYLIQEKAKKAQTNCLKKIYNAFTESTLENWGYFLYQRAENKANIKKIFYDLLCDPLFFLPITSQDKERAFLILKGFSSQIPKKNIIDISLDLLEEIEGLSPEGEYLLYFILSFYKEEPSWLQEYCKREYLNASWLQIILDNSSFNLSCNVFTCIQKKLRPISEVQKKKSHKKIVANQYKFFFNSQHSAIEIYNFLCDTFTDNSLEKENDSVKDFEKKILDHFKLQEFIKDFIDTIVRYDHGEQRVYLEQIALEINEENKWIKPLIDCYKKILIKIWENIITENPNIIKCEYKEKLGKISILLEDNKKYVMDEENDLIVFFKKNIADFSSWEKKILGELCKATIQCFSKTQGKSLFVILREHFQTDSNVTRPWAILTHPEWSSSDWKINLWQQGWTNANLNSAKIFFDNAKKDKEKFIEYLDESSRNMVLGYLDKWEKYWFSETKERNNAPDSEEFKDRHFRFRLDKYFQILSDEELECLNSIKEKNNEDLISKNYKKESFRFEKSEKKIRWTNARRISIDKTNHDKLNEIYEKFLSFHYYIYSNSLPCEYTFKKSSNDDELYAEFHILKRIFEGIIKEIKNKKISKVSVEYYNDNHFHSIEIEIFGEIWPPNHTIPSLFLKNVGNDLWKLYHEIDGYFSEWFISRGYRKNAEFISEKFQIIPAIIEIKENAPANDDPFTKHTLRFKI